MLQGIDDSLGPHGVLRSSVSGASQGLESDWEFRKSVEWLLLQEFLLHKQEGEPRDNAMLGQNTDPHGPIVNLC